MDRTENTEVPKESRPAMLMRHQRERVEMDGRHRLERSELLDRHINEQRAHGMGRPE